MTNNNVQSFEVDGFIQFLGKQDKESVVWFEYGPVRMAPVAISHNVGKVDGSEESVEFFGITIVPIDMFEGKEFEQISVEKFLNQMKKAVDEYPHIDYMSIFFLSVEVEGNMKMLGAPSEEDMLPGEVVFGVEPMQKELEFAIKLYSMTKNVLSLIDDQASVH